MCLLPWTFYLINQTLFIFFLLRSSSWHLNSLPFSALVSFRSKLIFQMVSLQFLKYPQYSPPDLTGSRRPADHVCLYGCILWVASGPPVIYGYI